MPELTIHYRDIKTVVQFEKGAGLLETIVQSGIPIEGSCGGRGRCGKCTVELINGEVHAKDGRRIHPLKGQGSRYHACQVYCDKDLEVHVPDLMTASGKILKKGVELYKEPEPMLRRHTVKIGKPTLGDPKSYQELLLKALEPGLAIGTASSLKELPRIVDEGQGMVEVFSYRDRIIHIGPGSGESDCLGLAIDIGTTTVAAMLADLHTGRLLAVETETNLQASYGADVISRIIAASTGDGLKRLHALATDTVNELVKRLCKKAKTSSQKVYSVTVAGNTTMNHLFAGVNPATLGTVPYVPLVKYFPLMDAQALGIHIHPAAIVEILPVIGGFVGADTVAGILATGQDLMEETTLFIDLGTNGEIVLGNREGLAAASTAAGPAFEGVHIKHGMRAVKGAIDRVTLSGDIIVVHTIDGSMPKGICGSGLIDTVALLLSKGIIDRSGRLQPREKLSSVSGGLAARIKEGKTGREFVLVRSRESGTGADITVSQGDIREVQLAKSAIATGIGLLMEERGITHDDIAGVYLAGAFGNSVNRDSAAAIGLIPNVNPDRVFSVGNAAGYGALMTLLFRTALIRAYTISKTTRHKELATNERFNSEFINGLSFSR
ncbi:MAG: Ferredoxin--NAD(P)(+) reductase (naphthalene dioxygenase/salicylate 5-hydroxylase ferredoxin-specific) [Syntrophorhabdus sp. PtaU1.Bin058]|nr:MAG: Ferredoxin--NAD(P)(+) reductase (naphthalene dioxygenase/salicylate 5-hydroxylase ferredoxin-specific) [Syntrophorhabdus sp. PtaU1.Bin058]